MPVTARFSALRGRPLGERKTANTYSWVAWWTCEEPTWAPFTPPDAAGGARTRADVPGLVQAAAPAGAKIKWISSAWCSEYRAVQREGVEARAEHHAQQEREYEAERQRARKLADDPVWQWRMRQQTEEWIRFRDSLTRPGSLQAPEWASTLGLTLPCTPDDVARAYRRLARDAHPDRGGDPERFIALSSARDAALRQLGV